MRLPSSKLKYHFLGSSGRYIILSTLDLKILYFFTRHSKKIVMCQSHLINFLTFTDFVILVHSLKSIGFQIHAFIMVKIPSAKYCLTAVYPVTISSQSVHVIPSSNFKKLSKNITNFP